MNKLLSWVAAICWMMLIFFLSHQPAEASSELSFNFLNLLLRPFMFLFPSMDVQGDWLHFFIRKNAHFFAYFVLGILFANALQATFKGLKKSDWKLLGLSLFLSVLYAISDEIHQLYIPGRSGEIRDVMIDSFGALTGIMLYVKLARISLSRY